MSTATVSGPKRYLKKGEITRARITQLGDYPDDWPVVTIGDLNPFVTSGSRGWARYYSDLGSPFIRITNMSRQTICLDFRDLKLVNIPPVTPEATRTRLEDQDVLVSITADIGIIGYVDERVSNPAYINQHIALIRFDPSETCGKFIGYFLASSGPQRLFRGLTDQGAKAGMSLSTVRRIEIVHPQLKEQQAIASALSDVDALIGALDKLIAKKRAIKLGTMQQLLTGKIRLKGFTSEWRDCVLSDIGAFSKGRGIRRDQVSDDGIPCVRYGEIYTRYNDYVVAPVSRISPSVAAGAKPIQHGDILFAGSGETAEEIGKCIAYLGTDQAYAGGDVIVLSPISDDPLYLGHLLNQKTISEQKARLGQGDAVVHISSRNLGTIKIKIPKTDEQRAIAAFLSDLDAAIAVLERRRDKTKAIKHGMMQALLTGRIRLVKPVREPEPSQ